MMQESQTWSLVTLEASFVEQHFKGAVTLSLSRQQCNSMHTFRAVDVPTRPSTGFSTQMHTGPSVEPIA